jgi:hypothetical protein
MAILVKSSAGQGTLGSTKDEYLLPPPLFPQPYPYNASPNTSQISIATNNQIAKTAFRCNSTLGPGVLEALTPTGVSGYAYNQVNLTYYPYDAELGWGFGQYSNPISAFAHFDACGNRIDGVFLGRDNYTTWGVKWYPADSGSLDGNPYWGLRLLGADSAIPGTNGSALYPGEYRTFLKVSS